MDFVCVLSVDGSLVSYEVSEENGKYLAVLKSRSDGVDQQFQRIALEKQNGNWTAQPWQEEIVQSIIKCIEANYVEQL